MISRAVNLAGWRRNALAFLLGVCATLALPPFFIFPMLIPAFSGLYLLIRDVPPRRAFWDGWFWGWGFYISGLYWFSIALLTDPEKFAWMIPFALFGVTAVIAIYSGVACWLFALISPPVGGRLRGGPTCSVGENCAPLPSSPLRGEVRLFFFTTIWLIVEYARGHLFTGFPWNLPGYSFAFSDYSMQLASLVGVYGLTWCAVWLGVVPSLLCHPAFIAGSPSDCARPRNKCGVTTSIVSYAILIIGMGWGAWRLHEADAMDTIKKYQVAARVRIVQANIAQHHKWDPQSQMQGLQEHILLSHAPGLDNIDVIIWPETAVPFVMQENSPLTLHLGKAIPEGKLLITGALHKEDKGDDYNIWNSMVALDHLGHIIGRYDKHRLVPFGEFIPFRSVLPRSLLTPVGDKDFSSGGGPQTVSWGELPPLSPLICYEAIFPEYAVDEKHRPALLLNLTNDAWFGMSTGPYQHFTMARMRAVEQGIPLIRVANTGISGLVDEGGRVVSKLDLGKKDILDIPLIRKEHQTTWFGLYGQYTWIILILAGLIAWSGRRGTSI